MNDRRRTAVGLTVLTFVVGAVAGAAPVRAACQVGPDVFDYGPKRIDAEAEQLAMHVSGELRAPDFEYERIRGDLAAIRATYPVLVDAVDDPDYVPDQLIVKLKPGFPVTGFVETNEFYQLVDLEVLSGTTYVLTFCDNLNAPVLAGIYEALPEVDFAEPNSLIGTDDAITVTELGTLWRYTIQDGFLDCFDGCDCLRLWIVDVEDQGSVTLVDYTESGAPWCDFPDTACCTPVLSCQVRPIGQCLGIGGVPLEFSTPCDGNPDGDNVDAICGDNCPAQANPGQEDTDGDGPGDACDNCPLHVNVEQTDLDHDGEGDVCDLDDGLIYLTLPAFHVVEWQEEVGFIAWNLYRGDFEVLSATGIYTQVPGSNPLAMSWCALPSTTLMDPIIPPPGAVAFYLATGLTAEGVESDLGQDSAGNPRPNTNPCF